MEVEPFQHLEMLLEWLLVSSPWLLGFPIHLWAPSCPAQHPRLLSTTPFRKPVNMTKATVNYRQEKTHMMSAVDRSFTDQSTLQEDERLGLSFMDAHGYSPRGECSLQAPSLWLRGAPHQMSSVTPEPKLRHLLCSCWVTALALETQRRHRYDLVLEEL